MSRKQKPVAALRVLVECAQRDGLSPNVVLKETGVRVDQLDEPDFGISKKQEIRAIKNILCASANTVGLGYRYGQAFQITTLGIWGFAIISSATIREAYESTTRFTQLGYLLAKTEYSEGVDHLITHVIVDHLPKEIRGFVAERSFGIMQRFLSEMLPDVDAKNTILEIRETPEYAAALSDKIGVQVVGDCDEYRVRFSKAIAEQSLPKADPRTRAYCIAQCQKLLDEIRPAQHSLTQKVRDQIVEQIDDVPSIRSISSQLGVSESTLRRDLKKEGASFRDIVLDARMSLARELLETAQLPVKSVCYQLGYSEPAAFVRAFTKWYGVPPGQSHLIKRAGR